jgi:hypothetical protein
MEYVPILSLVVKCLLPLGFCYYGIPLSPLISGSQSQRPTKDSNNEFFTDAREGLTNAFFNTFLWNVVGGGACKMYLRIQSTIPFVKEYKDS